MRANLKAKFLSCAGVGLAGCYTLGVLSGRYLSVPATLILGVLIAAALILLLRELWRRSVTAPVRDLLDHIQVMRRGTWTEPLPVRQSGEIGDLTAAVNDLGADLTLAAHQFATTSRLAAVAIIETRIGRRLNLATEHLASIVTLLTLSRDYHQPIPEAAIRNLELAMKDLREIQTECKDVFEREFRNQSHDRSAPGAAARQMTVASP